MVHVQGVYIEILSRMSIHETALRSRVASNDSQNGKKIYMDTLQTNLEYYEPKERT